jgi:cell division protease FtsH
MVTEYGFSEKLGWIRLASNEEQIFLARSVAERTHMSQKTAEIVDEEIKAEIDMAVAAARQIIEGSMVELEAVAKALLERETLDADEVRACCQAARKQQDTASAD